MSRRFANSLRRVKPSLQARIDYSHPAAPDLLCCPFNELAGPPRDLARWAASTVTGTAPTWISGRLDYAASGLHSFGDVTQFDGLSAFTVAFYARVDVYTSAAGVLNKRGGFTSQNALSIGYHYNGGVYPAALSCSLGSGSGETSIYQFTTGSPSGWGLWLVTYDSAAGAGLRWRAWRDTSPLTLAAASTDGAGTVPNTTSPLVIGCVNSDSPLYFDGAIEYLYAWSGARPELRAPLLDDPYCFLDDGPRRVYFVPSGVAPSTARNGDFNISLA